MPWDTHELAWAAGLFDGEGSTYLNPRPRMSVSQNDVYVLKRFQAALLGLGKIHEKSKTYGRAKRPVHQAVVTGWRDVQTALAMLWPWLSPQKRQQALRVMQMNRAAMQENGRWGDNRIGGNTVRICGSRHTYPTADCIDCQRIYWRRYGQRRKQKAG